MFETSNSRQKLCLPFAATYRYVEMGGSQIVGKRSIHSMYRWCRIHCDGKKIFYEEDILPSSAVILSFILVFRDLLSNSFTLASFFVNLTVLSKRAEFSLLSKCFR